MHRIESFEQGGGSLSMCSRALEKFSQAGWDETPRTSVLLNSYSQLASGPTRPLTRMMPATDCLKLHKKHLCDRSRAYGNSFYYLQVPHPCTFWSILQQEPPGRASGMARLSTLAILFIFSSSNRKITLCCLRPRRVSRYCIRNQTLYHNCKNRKSNRAQASA